MGTPAFFAVFLQSPGAGQAPDHVVVWVVGDERLRTAPDIASLSI